MFRVLIVIFAVLCLAGAIPARKQETTCAFADGKGMRIQYAPGPYNLKNGAIWTPGNQPMTLFLDTSVSIGGVSVPVGAYGIYVVPKKDHWTFIVNRSARPASGYDYGGDIVRATMGSGDLGHKVDHPQIAFVHIAPSQCNVRVYAGSTMAWEEIKEK
jgi:DUF2911 family protein